MTTEWQGWNGVIVFNRHIMRFAWDHSRQKQDAVVSIDGMPFRVWASEQQGRLRGQAEQGEGVVQGWHG